MKRTTIPLVAILGCLVAAVLIAVPGSAEDKRRRPEARAASCASCHEAQCSSWTRGGHAASHSSLKDGERKDVACVACHDPQQENAQGVGCASCHGTGFECGDWNTAVATGRRMPDEESCRTCHRASKRHPDLDFQFQVDYPAIAHESEKPRDLFGKEGIYRRFRVYHTADGLPHAKVNAVKVQGADVWAGTEDGIARLHGDTWKSWSVAEGLVHRAVTSMDGDEKTGELFVGTLGGISVFDGKRFTNYTQENSGLVNNVVFGVTLLGDDLWVATFDGISRLNRSTNEWKSYRLNEAPLDEVWIYGCEAATDRVNFAVWGGGLVEYLPGTDHWQAYHDPDGSFELDLIRNDGVVSQMTTAVSHDNGNVWVGSYFGTSRYDGRDWHEYNEDDSGLASNFINFIKARRFEGWHATDKGVSALDLRRGRWVNYRRLEGAVPQTSIEITDLEGKERRRFVADSAFPYDFVWGIDFSGEDLWIATSNGLARATYGTSADKLYPVEASSQRKEAAVTIRAPAAEGNRPLVGLVPRELFGKGFAQEVLGPEYTQPYVHFKKPHAVPLAKDFSGFVDPIGRGDTTFENDKEVRIGFLGCLSGPAKAYSEEMLRGAQLAVEEINAGGGYRGRPVVLKIRDDKATMGNTANQAVKLIYEDRVLAFLGSMSSDTTHVALRVALKGECAELTSISTDPTITQVVVPWIFRCLADDWSQSRALAKLVFQQRKFKRVALLERNNRYGRMGSAEIKRVAKRMGHPITLAIRYGKSTKTFAEHIRKIREYKADAIIIWGLYAKGAQIMRELDEAGLDIPVFGADGLVAPRFIELAGKSAEGVVVTYPYDFYRDDPVTTRFNRRFAKRYGHEPDSFAAHGYDAMYLVWNAVKKAGLNRTRIRDALAETRDFHGATGIISFDHRGNDIRGVDFAVVHEGKFLPLRMAGQHVRKGAHEK
ncbi:MAG: ABC transporter substrate-binding protein [Planctomycetota bacterium]|jgi:ABC-type branched-subunit amino acid transport system substrate-binding protein